jgi:protein-disulfide isomerase
MTLRALTFALALGLAAPALAQPAAPPSDEQRRMIEGVVRDYLLNNPEVLREAFQALERREQENQTRAQAELIERSAEALFRSPRQAVLGNPNGDVTVVEFFDYNCGFCKRALGDRQALLRQDPNLRWVLKEFPVLGPGSVEAAQISAQLLGHPRYAEFHTRLLGFQGPVDRQRALSVARELGMDARALEAGMNAEATRAAVQESFALGNGLGLGGTPSYVIGREVVVGAVGLEALRERIGNMRRCGRTSCG